MTGLFIVLEGGDGAGKTTQARFLDQWLEAWAVPHLLTREPGGSWLGSRIRELLLDPDSGPISPKAEALLYNADKAQHLADVVRPALGRGEVVVSDRYVDSTIAYQGAGRVLDPQEVRRLAEWATDGLVPDLTVLLDADVEATSGRLTSRDRLEAAGDDFHRRVRQHFLELASHDPGRYLVLSASDPREDIAAAVRRRLAPMIGIGPEPSPPAARMGS